MKTCITVFPSFPIRQTPIFVSGLRESFTSMRVKYDRQKLLEEVSVDEVIDIMLIAITGNSTSRTVPSASRNNNSVRVSTVGASTNSRQPSTNSSNASDILRSVAQTAQHPQRSQPPPYRQVQLYIHH